MSKSRGPRAASVPEHLRRSRIHNAGCAWAYTEKCGEELRELKQVDADAYEVLAALILDAQEFGLDVNDNGGNTYSVPVGVHVDRQRHFNTKPMPWLGELKAEGTQGKPIDYRLYFLETRSAPRAETDLILGSSLPPGKGIGRFYRHDAQTRQMLDAMWRGIKWCEQQCPARSWRTLALNAANIAL